MERKRTLKNRQLRKNRIRQRILGTKAIPRLVVHISNRHVSAQIIDDSTGTTLVSASTARSKSVEGTMTKKAEWVGTTIAKAATKAKIKQVVFDRSGRKYHGRVAALAEAARKAGLEF